MSNLNTDGGNFDGKKKCLCRNMKFYAYTFNPSVYHRTEPHILTVRNVNACRPLPSPPPHHLVKSKITDPMRRDARNDKILRNIFLLLLFTAETLQRVYAGNRDLYITFTCSSCINTKNTILCAVARPAMTTVFNHYSVNETTNFIPSQAIPK